MKYVCTLIVVKNIEQSKKFYRDLLEQEVIEDLGANVTLTGGFSLQEAESWQGFINKEENEVSYGNNDAELYFEEDDIDNFMTKLNSVEVEYVHPLKEHSWGQRVVRFYDLDKHIIEVGENMPVVVKRFIDSGLTVEQTAERMDVPVDYVKSLLCRR
ncbi:VOC family protein [Candidatus Contubernalis alkaliaceticus]|uniref:VOC family protein n=1 Tax=Candidatus Contubernalis alkaliaceticus TaxID=338645 RepID=UPI001F4C1FFD|nr:VOC family protein [Candidatus Contubernalis alkalaceticus]UNC91922.1 glyoxalase [Candidatus Contubernalis alkalaceticus]